MGTESFRRFTKLCFEQKAKFVSSSYKTIVDGTETLKDFSQNTTNWRSSNMALQILP